MRHLLTGLDAEHVQIAGSILKDAEIKLMQGTLLGEMTCEHLITGHAALPADELFDSRAGGGSTVAASSTATSASADMRQRVISTVRDMREQAPNVSALFKRKQES